MTARTQIVLLAVLCAVAGCNGTAESPRVLGPSVVVIQPPKELGAPQRPVVEFRHDVHSDAFPREGCKTCHRVDEKQRLIPRLTSAGDSADMDTFMNLYHDKCTDCHQKMMGVGEKTGPVTCGECHVERPQAMTSARSPLAFDYSLHYRHVRAEGDKCESCHHVLDEAKNELVYAQGAEDSCGACHGEQDAKDQTSLKTAVHTDCVSCHIQRKEKGEKHGPDLCAGCHAAAAQKEYEKVEDPPRLERGQPDMTWIAAEGAGSNLVAFDHRLHEPQTAFCSSCHHQTLKPCKECHTLTGDPEGEGITLEAAYHMAGSERSCVGCHQKKAAQKDCTGCHSTQTKPPSERSCTVCHSGPLPPKPGMKLPEVPVAAVELDALPDVSDDFPDTIKIDILADKYQPSEFPHKQIVAYLDRAARQSFLAGRFHQKTEALCAGCHHNSPPGVRPAPCKSCHDQKGVIADDKPNLFTAYHRQCLGCHIEMRLDKARDCTGCHSAKEASL
jgi:hypothetical protein